MAKKKEEKQTSLRNKPKEPKLKKFIVEPVMKKGKKESGQYIKVHETGRPLRYYKYKEGDVLDMFKTYYSDKYNKRRKLKGTIGSYRKHFANYFDKKIIPPKNPTLHKQIRGYINTLKQRGTFNEDVQKGESSVNVDNVLSVEDSQIMSICRNLLRPLVLDSELLNLIVQPQNLEKIKHRFSGTFTIIATDNRELGEIALFAETPITMIKRIKEMIKKHKYITISEDYEDTILPLLPQYFPNGYNAKPLSNKGGNVNIVKANLLFTKNV